MKNDEPRYRIRGRSGSRPRRAANSSRVVLGFHANQWSKLCAPTGTTCSRGMPCNRSASSTCVSFQTIVIAGASRITPLFVRLSQLATTSTVGIPSSCAART